MVHLSTGGALIKTLRSQLSVNDLRRLVAEGAVNAGPPPAPVPEDGDMLEVDRLVNRYGMVTLANKAVLAAEILAGRRVGIRIEPSMLMFFDPQTRELLRTRPNRLTPDDLARVQGLRKAGPPPRPSTEPIRVQRRVASSGVILVAGQRVSLGRAHAGQTVTVHASETTLAIELDDGETRAIRRTTAQPVRSIKGQRPRTTTIVS